MLFKVERTVFDKPDKIKVPGYNKSIDVGVIYNFAYKVADSDDGSYSLCSC